MSMVNMVLELLKTDVKELISAAIIAASIRPFKPVVKSWSGNKSKNRMSYFVLPQLLLSVKKEREREREREKERERERERER